MRGSFPSSRPSSRWVLAFITKEVITSILSGVFVGTIIYTVMKRLPIYNAISIVISLLVEKMSEEMEMVIFITLLGGLIIIMKNSGGARAYGIWAIQRVKDAHRHRVQCDVHVLHLLRG